MKNKLLIKLNKALRKRKLAEPKPIQQEEETSPSELSSKRFSEQLNQEKKRLLK